MPVKGVYRKGKLYGYKWGGRGHVYPISTYGKKGARKKAAKQGSAAHASGYRGGGRKSTRSKRIIRRK